MLLHAWSSFYELLGTASASLIGLLFVVVTLTAGRDRESTELGARIYLTPVVLHFSVVVAVCAIAVAPLPIRVASALAAFATGVGMLCAGRTGWRMLQAPTYPGGAKRHWSDIWLYAVAPGGVYLLAFGAIGAFWVGAQDAPSLFAGVMLILLMVCIRNAWDLVTSIAPGVPSRPS
ncbi:MAG TPA: hypothetical protein VKT30_05885 [Caulobacteraceae bacterium]|nr:hypothetical protein [Caulobacteraceae bacterium]